MDLGVFQRDPLSNMLVELVTELGNRALNCENECSKSDAIPSRTVIPNDMFIFSPDRDTQTLHRQ